MDLPRRIEEKRQKDAEQSKPSYTSLPAIIPPPDESLPWNEREPVFSLPTPMPDDPMNGPGGGELPDEQNAGEEPSVEPTDKKMSAATDGDVRASSSVVVSLVIIIGICFLLVNICAFGGIYYQRDKLRVRERLFNNRFRCNVAGSAGQTYDGDDDDDDDVDMYVKTQVPETAINAPKSGAYDSVALASVKPEAMGGKRLGKWAEISRQRSSSTVVTMDPHARVKEWINTEIIQRYSPRILRRQRREEKKRQLVCTEDPTIVTEKATVAADVKTEKARNKVNYSIQIFQNY